MKYSILLAVAGILMSASFSSCSFRMRAQGLPEKTSTYVLKNDGKRIDATKVSVSRGTVYVDNAKYPASDILAVKDKNHYTVISGNEEYQCIMYGKLNLLAKYGGMSYGYTSSSSMGGPGSGMGYRPSYSYFLERNGSKTIDYFSPGALMDYTSDNAAAYTKARAAKIWRIAAVAGLSTFIVGLTTSVLTQGKVRDISATAGLFAMPIGFISMPISNHKLKKAIRIYNGN
jgi:hypothetical protein